MRGFEGSGIRGLEDSRVGGFEDTRFEPPPSRAENLEQQKTSVSSNEFGALEKSSDDTHQAARI
jgi:hypothetical protein